MKANFYTESVLYWLARGTSALAQRLPPEWNVRLGAAAGTLLYHLLGSRRVVALDNLRAAFGQTYSPQEYRQIIRELFQNLGMTFMEIAAIPRIDRQYIEKWVTIAPSSRDRLESALAQGHGAILLTGHFGNWELISLTGALLGFPSLVLAREQGWPRLNRLLTQYRESKGCRIVTKGFPVRELIQGLREGRMVGILADQDGGRNGVLSPFFGRLASTAPGTIALSLNTQAPILPVFVIRTGGAAHTLVVEEPLAIPEEGTVEERIRGGLQAYMALLERYVRRTPSQWLWLHRRWKSSPERRLLIFSDGKAGHLSQSKALVQRIAQAWEARASEDKRLEGVFTPLVSTKTVKVAFRHPIWRTILGLVASVVPRGFSGGDFWLRLALNPATYRELQSEYSNISISCGASTAAVHLLWAWAIRSKTIHILRPRFPSWRRFNLVVLPRHDLPRDGQAPPNVLVTDGALVSSTRLHEEQLNGWRDRLQLSADKKRIGLLLGGAAKGVQLLRKDVETVIRGLVSAADRMDAELLITSSRRTDPEVEAWLAGILDQHVRCRLLVLVNRMQVGGLRSTEEAIPCILGLADALVVSGDSISMVSEAAATGKPVVCFPPRLTARARMPRASKYHRFLQRMDEQGRVQLVFAQEVEEAVADALEDRSDGTNAQEIISATDPVVEFLKKWL